MNLVILSLIFYCQVSSSVSKNDTQCIENPTGEVSLNVAVRGVPGPEGPQGHKGDIGLQGEMGLKGSKGSRGIQGVPGPVGSVGLPGPPGKRGVPGLEGPEGHIGPPGQAGRPGSMGAQGEPGDTVLSPEEFVRVTNSVHVSVSENVQQEIQSLNTTVLNTVMSELNAIKARLSELKVHSPGTKCGIFGDWRKIAYFDTNQGDSCPTGLRTVTNTGTFQRACGRTANPGCTSLQFTPNRNYTNVCGRVRGYQYFTMDGFKTGTDSIDSSYIDGISITRGNPRTHLWSYAVGISEQYSSLAYRCPCAQPNPNDRSHVPSFIGENFYCESGFSGSNYENRIAWEDPLWDGQGCKSSGNQCCNRYGWFHCEIPTTSDNIEVRWCANSHQSNEDVFTDQIEIWVM